MVYVVVILIMVSWVDECSGIATGCNTDKFAETNLRQTWPSRSCFNLTGSCDEALGLKMIKIETPTQL
jgi:hypothetical protein